MANAKNLSANTILADYLKTLNYSTKRNGGKNGDGKTATFCVAENTPRLTLPKRFLADGYLSGLVGVGANNDLVVVLSKNKHTNDFTALHQKQHFITAVGSVADVLRKTSYTYTVVDENTLDENTLSFVLKPNNDTYKPRKTA